jgi:hypothetical protein
MANERMSFYLFFLILVGWKQKGVWTLDLERVGEGWVGGWVRRNKNWVQIPINRTSAAQSQLSMVGWWGIWGPIYLSPRE